MKLKYLVLSVTTTIFVYSGFVGQAFSGTIFYEYDNLNRITKMENSGVFSIEYSYDAAGNRTQSSVSVQGTAFDTDGDGDVDGEDLHAFVADFSGDAGALSSFANSFGIQ
nr:hypothetical protein [uncultured Desulfobacter sp.]